MHLIRSIATAAMLAALLPATAAADIGPCSVADATYSWWTHPIAHVGPDGKTHVGTVSSAGEVAARRDCTKTVLEMGEPDDHDAAAVVTHATKARIAFYPGHNDRRAVRYRIGSSTREVALPGLVSYAQILTSGDRIVLLTRVNLCAWYLVRSDDWSLTWSAPIRLIDDCAAGGSVYLTTKPHQSTAGSFRLAVYGGTWNGMHYGQINISTGRLTLPGDLEVANVRSGSGLPLVPGKLAMAYESRARRDTRLLDVGQVNGRPLIVFAEWLPFGPARYVTAMYGATGTWVIRRSLPLAGKPFWRPSMYIGGASITDAGDIVVARESEGSWMIEQHGLTSTGWSRRATLAKGTAPLVRPYAVRGGDSVIFQRVARYTDYRHFKTSLGEVGLKP